ncbi:MAG: MoaD/ThiS family protein [Firmicutes bacterium]|nr:MoaD/ThiS family protein [Bacillota bacterium]MDH7495943.1 MoaD/ThiS family protein [Bacillota bacterium]
MRVRLFFFLRDAAGQDEVTIPADAAPCLRELVRVLSERFGERFSRQLVTETGEIRNDVNILVNGRNVQFLSGADTQLKDEDTVSFLSAVAGG